MRTFLEDGRIYGSTFLLYGNVNDDFYSPDLTVQKWNQYLVTLLKSRGYRYILFHGTKGTYCLDDESARFYFEENKGLSPAGGIAAAAKAAAKKPAAAGSKSLDSMFRRRKPGYNDGDLSKAQPADSTDAAPAPAPSRVRYALRNLTDNASFYPSIRDKMLDPETRMAVVFYDIQANFNFIPALKDDILHNYAQVGDRNLCLLVAPSSEHNTEALELLLRSNNLDGKFLRPMQGGGREFNPSCCFRLGYPTEDEICNMLHRFAVVGTSRGKRIRLPYHDLKNVAQYILSDSARAAVNRSDPSLRRMIAVAETLEQYIQTHTRGLKRLELTAETVDDIFGVHDDPKTAMKALERRGWEDACNKLRTWITASRNARKKMTAEKPEHVPDMALARFARPDPNAEDTRPLAPNFIIVGNPGTGKTTIARLIGQVLRAEGILKSGHCREVTQKDLTNSFVAGIPQETMARVDEAEEGVLFIDEAHQLARADGGANNAGSGVQIVSTLNSAMLDPNRHFSVILACYPHEMDAIFQLDAGFLRRFQDTIVLEDYQPELLEHILKGMIQSMGYELSPDLTETKTAEGGREYTPIGSMVERIYAERDRTRFGNAGDMETLATYATARSTDRVLTAECFIGGLKGKVKEDFFTPISAGTSKEQVLKLLEEEFVGMENIKELLLDLCYSIERAIAEGKDPTEIRLKPMILAGNPGAGKTTVANLLPKLFYHYGLLGTPEPIIVPASEFATRWQGGAQEKVLELVRKAQDAKAFLFVDEAHQLCSEKFDGKGALESFMQPLTDFAHPFLLCFGMYRDRVDSFLALDPGAASRFAGNILRIDDYTPEELAEIFTRLLSKNGYIAHSDTLALVRQHMKRAYDTRNEDTGNARMVHNFFDAMKTQLNRRCSREKIPFGTPESKHFLPDDIPEQLRKGLSLDDNAARLQELAQLEEQIRNGRVGNQELKDVMLQRLQHLRFRLRFPDKAKGYIEPGHFFFKGNAGAGKTTSVEFLSRAYFQMGLVISPEPIKTRASDLIGQYLGQTGGKTRDLLMNARGRVLLIDEAYALTDPNSHADSYKRDAVTEIVGILDDETYRRTTCVIFAGYEGDMDGIYKMNQGMRSRVKEIYFPDFSHTDCMKILAFMLADSGTRLAPEAEEMCSEQLMLCRKYKGFSNGRTVRKYAELLLQNRMQRCLRADENADPEEFDLILPGDLPIDPALPELLNLQ